MELLRHLAAGRVVGEHFRRHAHILVHAAAQFAQVEVLDRIVRRAELEGPARALELGLLHGGEHFVAFLGVAAGGLCVMFMLGITYGSQVSMDQPDVASAFNLLWSVPAVAIGLTRFERSRLAPYAEGKGPKLPEVRKELAIQQMDSDWEAVMKRKED